MELLTQSEAEERTDRFYRAYGALRDMHMDSINARLRMLGWPPDRVAVELLDHRAASASLKDDGLAVLALSKAIVVLRDEAGKLYPVRTLDLLAGRRIKGATVEEDEIR